MRSIQEILKQFDRQKGNDEAKHIKEKLLLEAILDIRNALWEPYRQIKGKIPPPDPTRMYVQR